MICGRCRSDNVILADNQPILGTGSKKIYVCLDCGLIAEETEFFESWEMIPDGDNN